jgi:hypothetical protein
MPGRIGINWVGAPEGVSKGKTYYEEVQIGEFLFKAGDCAIFYYQNEGGDDCNTYIRRLEHIYERESDGAKMAHVAWFERGTDSVVGDTGRQVFQVWSSI